MTRRLGHRDDRGMVRVVVARFTQRHHDFIRAAHPRVPLDPVEDLR